MYQSATEPNQSEILSRVESDPKVFYCLSQLCLIERAFSAVTALLNKRKNRLDVVRRGHLRLFLSEMKPDINRLMTLRQAHPSH